MDKNSFWLNIETLSESPVNTDWEYKPSIASIKMGEIEMGKIERGYILFNVILLWSNYGSHLDN